MGQDAACACSAEPVFYVGLPKEGTTSFEHFMRAMGYNAGKMADPHHRHVRIVYKHQELLDFARLGARAEPTNPFRQLDQHGHVALSDFPVMAIACQLSRVYPEARFVYAQRPLEQWLDSVRSQLFCEYMANFAGCNRNVSLFRTDLANARTTLLGSKEAVLHPWCGGTRQDNSRHCELGHEFLHWLIEEDRLPGERNSLDAFCEGISQDTGWCQSASHVGWAAVDASLKRVFDAHRRRLDWCLWPSGRLLATEIDEPNISSRVRAFLGCPNTSTCESRASFGRDNARDLDT